MQAANDLKVHLGWAVQVYNTAEALPNLINPFWMLPLLGVLGLKARDIVGFTLPAAHGAPADGAVPAVAPGRDADATCRRSSRVKLLPLPARGENSHETEPSEDALKVVVPFVAGGNTDLIMRALADEMAASVGQPAQSKSGKLHPEATTCAVRETAAP